MGWAGKNGSSQGTQLSVYPLGTVEEINSDREFSAVEITMEDFERYWKMALSKG